MAAEQVTERARAIARDVATSAPVAVKLVKNALALDRAALHQALHTEASHQATTYATDDMQEGLRAIREKREPRF